MTGRTMTDRQRIEQLFFPLVFKSILESAGQRDAGYDACIRALDAAAATILRREDQKRRAALMRRVMRLHDTATEPDRKGGVSILKIGMTIYYVLQAVLRSGYLELEEGSDLARAISAIIENFDDAFGEKKLDASAQKQARRMMEVLNREGYFHGVEFQREAA
jgi:hypothetical protein